MRALAIAALAACSAPPSEHVHVESDSALLVSTRDHLAICVQADPGLDGAALTAQLRSDASRLALDHPDWSAAGLDRGPVTVELGCPGAAAVERAVDARTGVLGPGLLAEPTAYRAYVYAIADGRAPAILGGAPHARAIAELAALDDCTAVEVSSALIAPASALGTPALRDALAEAVGLAPVQVARDRIIDAIPASAYVANGHALNATERAWVRAIGRDALHALPGERAAQNRVAARSVWWSLKEGVLDLDNPIAYSNCHFATGDARIGPLEVCPDPASPWQVGVAAVQVPNHGDAEVAAMAQQLFPGVAASELVGGAAERAGYAPGSPTYTGITGSTGRLRRSWLLRVPAIGIALVEPEIAWECITNAFSWCYGTGWNTSALFAPTRSAALGAMHDLELLLGRFP